MDANKLYNLMMSVEIQTEKKERETGKPLKMSLKSLRQDIVNLKKLGVL